MCSFAHMIKEGAMQAEFIPYHFYRDVQHAEIEGVVGHHLSLGNADADYADD